MQVGHPVASWRLGTRGATFVATLALIAAACQGGPNIHGSPGATGAPTAGSSEEVASPAAPFAAATSTTVFGARTLLASGVFEVPAARAFGEPGFHEQYRFVHELPTGLEPTAGRVLVLALRDVGRPDQTCDQDHPLSGCVTVDWSDSGSRPKVPPGGVFDNSIRVELTSGTATFYLSQTDRLADEPDRFDPG